MVIIVPVTVVVVVMCYPCRCDMSRHADNVDDSNTHRVAVTMIAQ